MRLSEAGLSLIELVIGLAILSILVLAALPSYSAWVQNTKIRNAAEAIVNGLQLARSEAVRRNTNVQLTLGANSDWAVSVVNPATAIQWRSGAQGSQGVTVTRDPPGASTITFNSLGRVAANADGSASLAQVDIDVPTSVLPASASRDLRVTVSAGGRVRMCDPSVTVATDTRYC